MIITTAFFVRAAAGAKLGSSIGIAAAGTAIAGTGPGAVLGGAAGAALAKGALWYVGAAAAAPAAGAGAAVGVATTAAALTGGAGLCLLSRTRLRRRRGHAGIKEIETLIERLDAEQARLDARPEPEWIVPPLDINKIPMEKLRVKTLTEIRAEWKARHERERRETMARRTRRSRATRPGTWSAWTGLTPKPARQALAPEPRNTVAAWSAWAAAATA